MPETCSRVLLHRLLPQFGIKTRKEWMPSRARSLSMIEYGYKSDSVKAAYCLAEDG